MKRRKIIFSFLISFVLFAALSFSASALHGDVNSDEYIGIEDAVISLRFAVGIAEPTEEQYRKADLDYDGYLTTEDVRLSLRGAADIEYIPDHFFSDFETVTEPTCTQKGLSTSYCLYCEKVVEKVLQPIGHSKKDATCTEASYCTECNETFDEPLGHTEKEGYCTRCNILLNDPLVTYNGKDVAFGCGTSVVKTTFGTPKDTLTDNYAETPVIIYVYYTDYTDLGIFTFTDGKLTQFFTNDTSAEISQGSSAFSLSSNTTPEKIGDIKISAYKDTLGNGKNYCYYGAVGDTYTLKKTSNYAVSEKLVFHLTNGCRALNGISTLKYSSGAAKVAAAHSKDMAKKDYFSHENPDGLRVGDRLTNADIDWYHCGENLVAGHYDPYAISNGWYNSEGHRKNILNYKFKYLGVGFAYSGSSTYKYYGTQNFYNDKYVE